MKLDITAKELMCLKFPFNEWKISLLEQLGKINILDESIILFKLNYISGIIYALLI